MNSTRSFIALAVVLLLGWAASAQMVLRTGTLHSYSSVPAEESPPPAAQCLTNLSILPSTTDYWSGLIHSQGIAFAGGTTNVCRLYVRGDTHNASDRPIYAQIRTAKNGGGTQLGGNSTTNTLLAGVSTVVELTFLANTPSVSGDYFVNICSADPSNHYLLYSASDEYGGTSYFASSGATDRAQDLWLIVCYQ